MARKSSAPVICQNRAVSPVAPGAYRRYALVYDLVWGTAPYDRFVDLCLEAAAAQGTGVRRVLVAACGTGSAAVELAERGYEVTAFDLSLEMLAVAAAKRWPGGPEGPGGSPPRLVAGDLRAVPLGDGWADLVLVLNASINYLLEPAEVVAALAHLGRTAAPGGTVVVEPLMESWTRRVTCSGAGKRTSAASIGSVARRRRGKKTRDGRGLTVDSLNS